jgi:hypothetical protein
MPSEPLTEFEIRHPDPKERRELKRLQPLAWALQVPPEMLNGGKQTEDTLAFLEIVRGRQSILRSMFGNDAL